MNVLGKRSQTMRQKSGRGPYVIAVFNQKGGVGKTTTSTNLALCLAAFDRSVAMIDLDSQGNATTSLGLNPPPSIGAYDLIMGATTPEGALSETIFPKLSIFASTEPLGGIDFELSMTEEPQSALYRLLSAGSLDMEYIIIDCPPALSMLPVNALVAADGVVIPVHTDPLSHDGLIRAWGNIKSIQSRLNPHLGVHGLLLTMSDESETERKLADIIRQEFGNKVYDTFIPRDHRVIDAAARDIPVVVFDPECIATRSYLKFTEEFLLREPVLRKRRGASDAENEDYPPFDPKEHAAAVEAALSTLRKWHHEIKSLGSIDFVEDSLGAPDTARSVYEGWAKTASDNDEGPKIPWGPVVGLTLLIAGFIAGFAFGASDRLMEMLRTF